MMSSETALSVTKNSLRVPSSVASGSSSSVCTKLEEQCAIHLLGLVKVKSKESKERLGSRTIGPSP